MNATQCEVFPKSEMPKAQFPTARNILAGTFLPFSLGAAALLLNSTFAPQAEAAAFTYTGTLNIGRVSPSATLLPNGKVLVSGGSNSGALSSAELYNPATEMWTLTGTMTTARNAHAAILLPNGKVLAAAGQSGASPLSSAELYDPSTGQWTPTGSLNVARIGPSATLLLNGKVLVAGGTDSSYFGIASAELFDPTTGQWTPTGPLNVARAAPAVLLPNGQVLVAGGIANLLDGTSILSSSEVYDSITGNWTLTGTLTTPRYGSTMNSLPVSGKVLITGGFLFTPTSSSLSTTELYDPALRTWRASGVLGTSRYGQTATLLVSGLVLVVGGISYDTGVSSRLASAELYDPTSEIWSAAGDLNTARNAHKAVLLQNNKVLVLGGFAAGSPSLITLASAEIYTPSTGGLPGVMLTHAARSPTNTFQFSFSSTPSASFTVLRATSPSAPLSNWASVVGLIETSPGQYQFNDTQAVTNRASFYRVRSP